MVGSVSGPAIGMFKISTTITNTNINNPSGPCIGGIIVTFAHWRIIYWLQFAMTALSLVLSLLFVPSLEAKKENKPPRKLSYVLSMFNPLRIFCPFVYPNVFLSVSPTIPSTLTFLTRNSISRAVYWQHSNMASSHLRAPSLTPVST